MSAFHIKIITLNNSFNHIRYQSLQNFQFHALEIEHCLLSSGSQWLNCNGRQVAVAHFVNCMQLYSFKTHKTARL